MKSRYEQLLLSHAYISDHVKTIPITVLVYCKMHKNLSFHKKISLKKSNKITKFDKRKLEKTFNI